MPLDPRAPLPGHDTIVIACPASGRVIRIHNTEAAREILDGHPELARLAVLREAPRNFRGYDFVGSFAGDLLALIERAGLVADFTSLPQGHEAILLQSAGRRGRREAAAARANDARAY